MNLIKRFLENRAERDRAEKMRITQGMEKATKQVVLKLENATKDMRSKNCPFQNVNCVGEFCVHFYKGLATVEHNDCFPSLPEFWKNYNAPACKLWHE